MNKTPTENLSGFIVGLRELLPLKFLCLHIPRGEICVFSAATLPTMPSSIDNKKLIY